MMYSRAFPATSMLARPLVSPAGLPQPALSAAGIMPAAPPLPGAPPVPAGDVEPPLPAADCPPVPVGEVAEPPHDRQSATAATAIEIRPEGRSRRCMGPS